MADGTSPSRPACRLKSKSVKDDRRSSGGIRTARCQGGPRVWVMTGMVWVSMVMV